MKIIFLQMLQGILITLLTTAGIINIARINLDSLFSKEARLNKIKALLTTLPERPTIRKQKIGGKLYIPYEEYYSLFKLAQLIKIQADS